MDSFRFADDSPSISESFFHYHLFDRLFVERPDEVVQCTPLGYAPLFPGASYQDERCVAMLREHGAME